MARTFHVIIEQDEDGGYVGKVPELQGCLSQGDSLDDLMKNIKEAIELYIEEAGLSEDISSSDTIVVHFEVKEDDKATQVVIN